jgi:hypothetical protein
MHAGRERGVQALRQTLCDNRFRRHCNDCSRVCLQRLYIGQLLSSKIDVCTAGLVPSTIEPERICSRPIPARLCRIVIVIARHQRHICGTLCPCLGFPLGNWSACRHFGEWKRSLPAAIWLFHFLEMGDALPELVGEADWRPVSRAMLGEGLRVRTDSCDYVHLSEEVRICFMDNHKARLAERLVPAQG